MTVTTTPNVTAADQRRLMGSAFDLSGATTAQDARILAGLDWEPEHRTLFHSDDPESVIGDTMVLKERGVVNSKTGEFFGVVGKEHTFLPNEEFVDFADTLMAEAGTTWAEAEPFGGARAGGASPFLAFRLPEGVQIAGQDAVNLHLLMSNGHVGNGSAVITALPIRDQCSNVVSAAIRRGSQNLGTYRIQHSGDMDEKLAHARAALSITTAYMREFETMANRMAEVEMSLADFDAFLTELVPVADGAGKAAVKTAETRRGAFRQNWSTPTLTDDLRATTWGALNIVTEVIDHGSLQARASHVGADERRMNSVHFGDGARLRQRAYNLLRGVN